MSSGDYKLIVRSSAISGSAGIATILIGFARTKLIALFAGTAGVGLLGLYTSVTGFVAAATSMGLGSSAVRDIAEAAGSDDSPRVARTVMTLRRLCWFTGLLGSAVCVLASCFISSWTFGTPDYAHNIAILGLCVLIAQVSAGQGALLRGLRKITQLAYQSIAVSLVTLALAGAVFYKMGPEGVMPYLVAAHLAALAGTWWYARGIKIEQVELSLGDTLAHGRSMVALGVAFQLSGVVSSGASYLVGVFLYKHGGADLNGLYQAAWGTSGALASLVLGAMGQDFYPRLAAVAKDSSASMRLINQQSEIGVLLALPLLAGFAALVPILIPALFSNAFVPAIPAVIWFVLGAFGRVVSWPLGFYLMASGRGWWFLGTEIVFASLHLGLAYWLISVRGLEGAGSAWFCLYLTYWIGMALIVRLLCGQLVGKSAIKLGVAGFLSIGLASILGPIWGALLTFPVALFALRSLVRRVGQDNRLVERLISLPLIGKFIAS